MSDETIRAALEAAKKMRCCRGRPCLVEAGEMQPPCGMPFHATEAAATIAAFLRALPSAWVRDSYGTDEAVFKNLLIEAVEEAAREP